MSSAVIGALRVVFGADTAAFEKGVSKAERRANKFERRMGDMGKKLKIVGAAAATGFVTAFSASAKTVIEETQKIKTLTDSLNMPFEQFQRDVFAAKVVGIEMEKLGDIFRDTEDKIGDFIATGAGPMADFFDNIGPKVGVTQEAFKGLSGKQSLQLYFDSLQKANVSQEEMIFYLEAIASDATNLIPLLENGGKAWDEYGAKAAVVTEEQAAKTREYTMRMNELEQSWKAFVIGSLDAMDKVSVKYEATQKYFYDLGREIEASINGIPAAFGRAVDNVTQYLASLGQVGIDMMAGLAQGITKGGQAVWNALMDVVGDGVKRVKSFLGIASPSKLFEQYGSWVSEGFAKGIIKRYGLVESALQGMGEKAQEFAMDIVFILDRAFPELRRYNQLLSERAALEKAVADGILDQATAMRASASLGSQAFDSIYGKSGPTGKSINEGPLVDVKDIGEAMRVLEKDLGLYADEAGVVSVRVQQTFKDMAEGVIGSIQSLSSAIKGGGFFGILGAAIGLFTQFGSTGLFGKSIQSNLNGSFGGARANGGPVSAGSTYLVGERGPELYTAGSSGYITSNDNLRGIGGGMNVTVTMDPSTGALGAFVRDQSGQVVAQAAAPIANAGASIAGQRSAQMQSRMIRR